MASKHKKRVSPGRAHDAKRVAAILATANVKGDRVAAAEFKVGERSIRRWRARAESGEWPELTTVTGKLRDAALDQCKDLLTEAYQVSLRRITELIPTADIGQAIKAAEMCGGLKITKDALGGDPDSPAGKGSPA